MNEKQFRAYEFMRYFIEDTKIGDKLNKGEQMMDLSDVKGYHRFNFPDHSDETKGMQFTYIETYTGGYVANVAYEEFRGIHNQYLIDEVGLDSRTIKSNPLK